MEKHAGVAQNSFGHWRNGTKPRLEAVIKLCRTFSLSPRWLLLGEGDPLDAPPTTAPVPEPSGSPLALARGLVNELTGRDCQVAVETLDAREGRLELRFWPKGEKPAPVGNDLREGPTGSRVHDPPGPLDPKQAAAGKSD